MIRCWIWPQYNYCFYCELEYEAYQEELPLQPDWRQRTGLCNLYPLLVHLNLFGGSYAGRVGAVLREYT